MATMSRSQCEAELRRIWGADFDQKLDKAGEVFETVSGDLQTRINGNDPAHLAMLANMGSEAYANPKHPDHASVSTQVNDQFNFLFGSDAAVF